LILNVGCGNKPSGTVNCDLFLKSKTQRNLGDYTIKPEKLPNFVLCDAHKLPFHNNSFKTVYAHHVLEHLKNPLEALEEWARVASKTVLVVVPDLAGTRIYGDFQSHLYSWSRQTLENLLGYACGESSVTLDKKPLQVAKGGKLGHLINFLLKRVMIHTGFFSYTNLIGRGHIGNAGKQFTTGKTV